jgi:hypothetical protein
MNNNCSKCYDNNIINKFFCCNSNEKSNDLCDACREKYFILFPNKQYEVTKKQGLSNLLLEHKKYLYKYLLSVKL